MNREITVDQTSRDALTVRRQGSFQDRRRMTVKSRASRGAVVGLTMAVLVMAGVVQAGAQSSSPSYETNYPQGYWLVGGDGGVFSFGAAQYYGRGRYPATSCETAECTAVPMSGKPVGLASTPDGRGYWLAGADGSTYAFGDAHYQVPESAFHPAAPVVAIVGSGNGGYWLAAADGGVFTAGPARFYGSAEPDHPVAPIVAMAATPDGGGYWLLGRDGGVFSFGDASYHGRVFVHPPCPAGPSPGCGGVVVPPRGDFEVGGTPLGIASSPDGGGYWIATAAGELAPFGDTENFGSPAQDNSQLAAPVVGISAVPTPLCSPPTAPPGSQPASPGPPPEGYWIIGADGGVFSYGDAQFHGSAAGMHLVAPIVGSAGMPPVSGCPV